MNKTLKWILIGLGIAVAAFLIALPIMGMVLNGGRMGLLGHGMILGRAGRGMMMFPMFGIFGFLRFLVPLGVLALAVVGVVLLVRNGNARKNSAALPPQPPQAEPAAAEPRVCRHCGKPLHAEGEFCPFCGKKQ